MPTETEIKIKIDNIPAMQQKLLALKAELYKKRALEVDEYFDKKGALQKTDQVLRLRDNTLLTYKGPQEKKQKFKVREEIEVMVDKGEYLRKILEKLGYTYSKRKEKYRESYVLGTTKICIDETPMGNFLEIEGTKESVQQAAQKLGFTEKQFIKKSYTALWEEYAAKNKIKGGMVFSK